MPSLGGGASGGGQQAVVTGPTLGAASAAAQAQEAGAAQASQIAQQDTQSAIQALLGEYNTSLGITQPIRAMGNQAAAQMNYMLGLPAASPGTAPVAPTAPTLQSLAGGITDQQMQDYIRQNSQSNMHGTGPGQAPGEIYTGVGSTGNKTIWGDTGPQELLNPTLNDPRLKTAIQDQLAQQQMPAAQDKYTNQQQIYQQQQDAFNQATNVYNQYNAKGTASASDINNIVTQLPGYQFQMGQGINSLQNAASAKGMLNSGNLMQGLSEFGQGLATSYYQNYLNNLSGLAGMGNAASSQAAAGANTTGAGVAQQYGNLATTQSDAALAAAQAQASSYLLPAANQQIISQSLGGNSGGGAGMLGSLGLGVLGMGTSGGSSIGGDILGKIAPSWFG